MAALTGEVRSASVIALTHLVVLEIGAPLIRNVFQTNARSMQHFAEVMAAREAERLQMSQAQEQEFGRTILQKIRDTSLDFLFNSAAARWKRRGSRARWVDHEAVVVGQSLFPIEHPVNLLIVLALGHFVADFPLQGIAWPLRNAPKTSP